MAEIPVYKIGQESAQDYAEVVELQERNSYDTSAPHRHDYMEVFLFTKGGGNHDIDFVNYPIHANSIHFVFPNQIHKVARELDTHGHVILISREYMQQLDYDLFVQLFYKFYLNPCVEASNVDYTEIHNCVNSIKSELLMERPGYKSVVKGYMTALFNQFLRLKALTVRTDAPTKDFKLYMDLLLLVEDNYLNHHPVSFYSEQLQVSGRKLGDICKEFSNSTCSNIISDRIVLEAKRQLLFSNDTVKEIVFALNFKDPAYFNRFFKAKTGLSPTAFVEQYAKKYKR